MYDTFIRMPELASTPKQRGLLPVRANTIWRWVRVGLFPRPVKLGPQVSAWSLADIQQWARAKGVEITVTGGAK